MIFMVLRERLATMEATLNVMALITPNAKVDKRDRIPKCCAFR